MCINNCEIITDKQTLTVSLLKIILKGIINEKKCLNYNDKCI